MLDSEGFEVFRPGDELVLRKHRCLPLWGDSDVHVMGLMLCIPRDGGCGLVKLVERVAGWGSPGRRLSGFGEVLGGSWQVCGA